MSWSFVYLFQALLASTFVLAWWQGRGPERVVASAFGLAYVASLTLGRPLSIRYVDLEVGVLLVDVTLLVTLWGVALAALRLWPVPVVAIQAVATLAHLGRVLVPEALPGTYWTLLTSWAWLQLLILLLAIVLRSSRRRNLGRVERSWNARSHALASRVRGWRRRRS